MHLRKSAKNGKIYWKGNQKLVIRHLYCWGNDTINKILVPLNGSEVICDVAREKWVDLVAMSTHGLGGVKRWSLWSVADKVIQVSPVPVLLYRSTDVSYQTDLYFLWM
ncbi:MAG: universal stress protein [Deltaproteobacteria bacterium]|nr:universal stress protein [Deltaproteobacteria bacterium]